MNRDIYEILAEEAISDLNAHYPVSHAWLVFGHIKYPFLEDIIWC